MGLRHLFTGRDGDRVVTTTRGSSVDFAITIGAPPPDPFYRYWWQGRPLPSWSTIRAAAGMRPQIHAWALGGMADAAVAEAGTLAAAVATGDESAVKWARARLWDAAVDARDSAARLGTRVHEAVETGLALELAPPDLAPKLAAFYDWLRVSRAQILGQEYAVYNLTVGYGGTVDLLVLMPDGSIWVVDLKTGKSLWGEYALQIMGYVHGEFVGATDDEGVQRVDEALTAFHRAARGMAVLHLSDSGWEFRSLTPDPRTWAAFQGLLAFADWQHDHDDIASVTAGVRRSGRP